MFQLQNKNSEIMYDSTRKCPMKPTGVASSSTCPNFTEKSSTINFHPPFSVPFLQMQVGFPLKEIDVVNYHQTNIICVTNENC